VPSLHLFSAYPEEQGGPPLNPWRTVLPPRVSLARSGSMVADEADLTQRLLNRGTMEDATALQLALDESAVHEAATPGRPPGPPHAERASCNPEEQPVMESAVPTLQGKRFQPELAAVDLVPDTSLRQNQSGAADQGSGSANPVLQREVATSFIPVPLDDSGDEMQTQTVDKALEDELLEGYSLQVLEENSRLCQSLCLNANNVLRFGSVLEQHPEACCVRPLSYRVFFDFF